MPIYDRPVHQLLREMIESLCRTPGQTFTRQGAVNWFKERYPKILPNTVGCHLIRFSTNAPSRFHYSVKQPDEDLLFQIDSTRFRRFEIDTDPAPLKPGQTLATGISNGDEQDGEEGDDSAKQFAYEHDLRDFLAKNLALVELGLRLHKEDEGLDGVEFPAGGRFIDILARDPAGNFVVIELKVSRGYERTIGQLLRYIAWIERNVAKTGQQVRGVIVAREITEDLQLATSSLRNITLLEYEIAVKLRPIDRLSAKTK